MSSSNTQHSLPTTGPETGASHTNPAAPTPNPNRIATRQTSRAAAARALRNEIVHIEQSLDNLYHHLSAMNHTVQRLSENETRDRNTIVSNTMKRLPVIPPSELAEDAECSICMEPYKTGCDADAAVRLPCGHVFGSRCLATWFSSGGDTCPLCRGVLFEVRLNQRYTAPRPRQVTEWPGFADFLDRSEVSTVLR